MEIFYIASIATVCAIIFFIFLNPTYKLLTAFIVMTDLFDFAPTSILSYGTKLWDIGFCLLLLVFLQSLLKRKKFSIRNVLFIKFLIAYIIYLLLILVVSILSYNYPILLTIKASRYIVGGSFSFFIFYYLFYDDDKALIKFVNALYVVVFICTIVHIFQYIFSIRIFSGYQGGAIEEIRSIPIFIPFVLFFLWKNLIKFFLGYSTSIFDKAYIIFGTFSILLTFTRGIYFILFVISLLMLGVMTVKMKKLKISRLIMLFYLLACFGLILIPTGKLDKVIDRAVQGVDALKDTANEKLTTNTFGWRLLLVEERLDIIAKKNSMMGLGFIHEDIAHRKLAWKIGSRNNLIFGMLNFFSGDIAWGNLVAYLGLCGVFLFLLFVASVMMQIYKVQISDNELAIISFAAILQFAGTFLMTFNSSIFSDNRTQIPMLILAIYLSAFQLIKNPSG